MGKQGGNKFTWVIKKFCSLQSKRIYSDEFVAGGCKWRLLAFPKGNGVQDLSLYLEVAGSEFLPSGWCRDAELELTVVNQVYEELSVTKATGHLFDATNCDFGFTSMLCLNKINDCGFVVNGELKIVVKVDVFKVIGKQDVPDEPEEVTKEEDVESSDLSEEALPVEESIDVNGFQVLPSQVECVRRIFEKHPEIASDFRPKNQYLKSAYMSVLLGLIETMCQPTQELSKDDLADAESALEHLTNTGLNLDWLEDKLDEVTEKKENEEAGETRIQETEEDLKELKLKCSNLEAQLEKEKENVSVARAPMSFDDVI